MPPRPPADASAGYEAIADAFRAAREHAGVGVSVVAEWAQTLPPDAAVLDLGCGAGVPVAEALARAGCRVWGIDASPSLVRVFHERFPQFPVACEDLAASAFFGRQFDAVAAVGVLFLLPPDTQRRVIPRVAEALLPGGSFLFTAPATPAVWNDVLTGQPSASLGAAVYKTALAVAGLTLVREMEDEGANHYFVARRRGQRRAGG